MIAPLLLLFLQAGDYQAGMQAYSEHRFLDAIPLFEKAAAGGPHALTARYMLGNACLAAHQDSKAVEAFAATFDAKPDSAAAYLLAAAMMLRAQMTAPAAAEAAHALAIDPHLPQAHYLLGEAALAQGDSAKAAAGFQKEIAANPGFFMAYYRLGAAFEIREAWDDAITALERAIWLNANHSGLYTLIGKAYLKRGNLDDAQAALHHALQMDPKDQPAQELLNQAQAPAPSPQPPAPGAERPPPSPQPIVTSPAYLKGIASYHRHDYAAAATNLKAALSSVPEGTAQYRETLQMIGRSEYLAGQIAEAIPWIEKAKAAGILNNELLFVLGNSYLQTHQVPKGRTAFAELYGVPADSAAARLFTAHMLMILELEDEAQAELEAAVARDPKLPEAHFMLGEIAIYRADHERAVNELKREIALNPAFAMAWYRLGDDYTRREDWEHAVPPLQRAVWLDPTYSGPYILLGKAYFKQGDLPEAERLLRRALQHGPAQCLRALSARPHPHPGRAHRRGPKDPAALGRTAQVGQASWPVQDERSSPRPSPGARRALHRWHFAQ